MAKRQKTPDPVIMADLSVVSFGDMMTLMLTFFVLLFSMSEIRRERVVATLNNFRLGQGIMPFQKSPIQTFIRPQRMTPRQSRQIRQGLQGRQPDRPTVQPTQNYAFVLRGEAMFEPNSPHLTDAARNELRAIASEFDGYKNVIEIRGHTADTDGTRDPWRYGYERAYNAMRFLVDGCGLDESRFELRSRAQYEPEDRNNPDANRRIEISMTDRIVNASY